MSEGWQEYSLGQLVELKYGKDHKFLGSGEIPCYGSAGIMRYVDSFLYDQQSILIPRKGSLNNIYYVEEPFWTVDTIFWSKIKIDSFLPKFLYYKLLKHDFMSMNVGAAVPSLTVNVLNEIKINLPPLPIQQKIAAILSAYDDLIENNNKRIKLLEELAQITYEEWFVRMKFPNHETTPIDEATGLPVGWERKKLGDLGTVITGKTPSTSNNNYYGENIPFIKIPDLHGSCWVLDTDQKLSFEGSKTQKNKLLPTKSLVVSCIGTVGLCALTSKESQTNQQINAIVFSKEYYSYFTYLFAKRLKPLLEGLGSNGATMPNVNKGKFESIEVLMPQSVILDLFHKMVSPVFESTLNLQSQNQHLKEARDLLLPRLMSGMIDVDSLTLELETQA